MINEYEGVEDHIEELSSVSTHTIYDCHENWSNTSGIIKKYRTPKE